MRGIKYKVFNTLLLSLTIMLILISLIFAYNHKVSESVIRENLEASNKKQLEFSIEQLEKDIKHLEKSNILLAYDSHIKSYVNAQEFSDYTDYLFQKRNLEEKLLIQQRTNNFYNELTIYWPQQKELISTSNKKEYDSKFLIDSPKNKWFITNNEDQLLFHYLVSNPYHSKGETQNVTTIVETTLTDDFILSTLESLDSSGTSRSFFLFQDSTIISKHSINQGIVSKLENELEITDLSEPVTLKLDHEEYSVHAIEFPLINTTLISYLKVDDYLLPLANLKRIVQISLILLFICGLFMALLLYRNIHYNLKHLIESIERFGKGDYTSRVRIKANNEFQLLFNHFNSMAERIQSLIVNVYEEKIRTREAEYKHLQSQINPHFLYNSLFYVVTMAKRSPNAVISMANNLAKYYRYITKKSGNETNVCDELEFIENYLEIQSLRKKSLQYTTDIPNELKEVIIPPLSIQPIVENAIIHGVDQRKDAGIIKIRGNVLPNGYQIVVEDDGVGMSDEEIKKLTMRLDQKIDMEEMGLGLSNIHQRIIHKFGENSGLIISKSSLGGLRVTVCLINVKK